MISFFLTIGRFIRAIWYGLRDPEFRALLTLVVIILGSGTVFYWRVEGWSVLDSLYFSVITLTTIGYGDLSPTTPASKIFTMCYILVGIGVLVVFVEKLARHAIEGRATKEDQRQK